MKKLKFVYEMQLEFDAPVNNHYYYLHCRPQSAAGQRLNGYTLSLTGDELALLTDSFGNEYYSGRRMAPHDKFGFKCEGIVWTGLPEQAVSLNTLYRYSTEHTRCGSQLEEFFQANLAGTATLLEQVKIFMQSLYECFAYTAGATVINTTAEQAFRQRSGVCQDYAHILLALCRCLGVPARYAAGLLTGEGASHAWAEVFDGEIWHGFDPTHNCEVNDDYIKFAAGRDYKDCLINKGLFCGSAGQLQKIYANVEEV